MIRLTTTRGTVSYDPAKGTWRGNADLRAIIAEFPEIPIRAGLTAPLQPDPADEAWVFLHAYWALRNAHFDVKIAKAPEIPLGNVPAGSVA